VTRERAPKGAPAAAANDSDERTAVVRDKFAMVPESLISGRIAGAGRHQASLVYLYAYLDLHQGENGRRARNLTRIAEALGYQARTVSSWVTDLERARLVEVVREGQQAIEVSAVHNPARDRRNDGAAVEVGTRAQPIKAGTRATHRARRGARPLPPVARSSREVASDLSREERARSSREERAQSRAKNARTERSLSREERAPAQVYEGLNRSVVRSPREYSGGARDDQHSAGFVVEDVDLLEAPFERVAGDKNRVHDHVDADDVEAPIGEVEGGDARDDLTRGLGGDRCTICLGAAEWFTDDGEPRCMEHTR
jgi:hypothetical protein